MRDLYQNRFQLKADTWVYVPSEGGRARGKEIKHAIEGRWRSPGNYYHLRDGGHVAAVRRHNDAVCVASLDLRRFFDQITRSKVHRALKRIGFSHGAAWGMACDSTVDKLPPQRRYSIPFGFVQSPVVASLVLAQSHLGTAISALAGARIEATVYVDDITLSGPSEAALTDAIGRLCSAAEASGSRSMRTRRRFPPLRRSDLTFNSDRGGSNWLQNVLPSSRPHYAPAVPNREMAFLAMSGACPWISMTHSLVDNVMVKNCRSQSD